MKNLDNIAKKDQKHFTKCPECNEWFDRRDLGQVFQHIHDEEVLEDISYKTGLDVNNPDWTSSRQVGDSEEFLNDENKTKLDLN